MELNRCQNSIFEFGMQNAIQTAERQSVNLDISVHEVGIQSMNAESIYEVRISVDIANRSRCSSIRLVNRARQKVKNRIRNVNALLPLKFWRELLVTCV